MKAVIPVAGLGTRMLPATKAIPKEMLPIVDKPLIQYVVEEAVASGIREIVLVTHASKNNIANHFDTSFELESTLEKRVKRQLLEEVKSICPSNVTIMEVRQGEAKGLGHAILKAYPCIGDEPFAVLLPDVLINQYSCDLQQDNLAHMIARFNDTKQSQVLLERVPSDEVSQYGIADCDDTNLQAGGFTHLKGFIEKPNINMAPSNLAIVGRYVFTNTIWSYLKNTPIGLGGEVQLTDAMVDLASSEPVEGYQIKGQSLDCGNKKGYMRAIIEYGLQHEEVGPELRNIINRVAG